MTSVKLINHSSSTADWNYYIKNSLQNVKIMSNETISNLDLKAIYLETEAGDIYGLFSEYRLKDAVLPKGLIAYGVRHSDDDDSVPSTIEPSATVNYFGSLIVDRPLDFRGKDHIDITEWGFDEDEELSDSLKQYLDK